MPVAAYNIYFFLCLYRWQDIFSDGSKRPPYLKYQLQGDLHSLGFCPYEDCLGIGHGAGFTSIIVPGTLSCDYNTCTLHYPFIGSGEPNIDTLEPNPYQTVKQRQEWEVKSLLEKIPSDLITLNPDLIGKMDDASSHVLEIEKLEQQVNICLC